MSKKNMIKIKVGSGEAFSDIKDVDIKINDQWYKLEDLLNKVLKLEDELQTFKQTTKKEFDEVSAKVQKVLDDEQVADDLLAKSVELLSKKVARIEQVLGGK